MSHLEPFQNHHYYTMIIKQSDAKVLQKIKMHKQNSVNSHDSGSGLIIPTGATARPFDM